MKEKTTIGIIVALPDYELNAALLAFNIEPDSSPTILSGERYWMTDLVTATGEELKIIISSIGYSGNTESQLPVERIINNFSPELLIFSGIACGVRQYKLGDVVTSDSVWAYEYVKTQKETRLDRSRAKTTPRHIQDDVQFFNKLQKWHDRFEILQETISTEQMARMAIRPNLDRSVWIASGEKVLCNDELTELNKQHDLIRAGEMEGYGFASACEDRVPPSPWLIVRGISDYGDEDKDNVEDDTKPKKDEYHQTAANSALTFVRVFLEHSYTTSEKLKHHATISNNNKNKSEIIIDPISVKHTEKINVFSSNDDPLFVKELYKGVAKAKNSITFFGLGHSLLKKNIELVRRLSIAVYNNTSLNIEIYYCDPNNEGLKNRVEEEYTARKESQRTYRKEWPTVYFESIINKIRTEVHPNCIDRFSVFLTQFMSLHYLIRIDDIYYLSLYGTPNLIGPESPWIVFKKEDNIILSNFLDECGNFYKKNRSNCRVKNTPV